MAGIRYQGCYRDDQAYDIVGSPTARTRVKHPSERLRIETTDLSISGSTEQPCTAATSLCAMGS